jgi:transcriptional regulator GlxA family with amidase domain
VFVDLSTIYAEGVTPDRYPLAYFLFSGNRAEKMAMLEMLQQLRRRFGRKHCVVAGDRGLDSAPVVQALDKRATTTSWRCGAVVEDGHGCA